MTTKKRTLNNVYKTVLLGACGHHGAALLRAEVRNGSVKHIDLVEEVDS